MLFVGENGPGCFTIAKVSFLWAKGVVIKLPMEGGRIPSKNNAGVMCVGIDTIEQEAVGRVSCFGDKVYTYAFGMRPGTVKVNLLCFFGKGSGGGGRGPFEAQEVGDAFKQLLQDYNKNRISKSLKQVKVFIPGRDLVIQGDLDAMQTSTKDPNSGIQNVTLVLTTTEPQGKL